MKNKFIAIILVGLLLSGCGTAEVEQKELEKEQSPEEELVELLDIKRYEYPNKFEVNHNLELLLENMAINYKNYNVDVVFDEEMQSRFVHNFCQNSWNCIDYVYDSLERSNGILHKPDVEYIQYSLSGKYIEFDSLKDDVEIDVNDCSSGFLYAELNSYEVISDDENIELRAEFEISDNSIEEADIKLVKNEYSCFDGYSVKSFSGVIGDEERLLEITSFDEVEAKPELDDKLSKSIKIYNDEIEGEITNFVNGSTGDIKVDRVKISESKVEYIFSQGDKELFRTPQLENYNSFEYIQFCDINADKVPEILVASYVQNSAGYEVKEFYVYKEKDSSWKELASYNLDADGQIKSLLKTRIDIGDAALDVELSEKGIEIIASIGSRATDDDGDYWEWENYHVTIAER